MSCSYLQKIHPDDAVTVDSTPDNVAGWAMTTAIIMAAKCGLDIHSWIPTCFAVDGVQGPACQGPPMINGGRPCFTAEMHINTGYKTLLYTGNKLVCL